jgi:hypothetical protein
MESVGAILAEVATNETMVLFEEDVLRHLSVEELYDDLEQWLEDIHLVKVQLFKNGMNSSQGVYEKEQEPDLHTKEKQLKQQDKIVLYLFELYRRNLQVICSGFILYEYDTIICMMCNKEEISQESESIHMVEFSDYSGTKTQRVCCSKCYPKCCGSQGPLAKPCKKSQGELIKKLRIEKTWNILTMVKSQISIKNKELKAIQKKMAMLSKKPAPQNIAEEINELMDTILDKNGNKISKFKEYVTPEHYRLIRSGCDVSEWSMEEQSELLTCLRKMNKIENI